MHSIPSTVAKNEDIKNQISKCKIKEVTPHQNKIVEESVQQRKLSGKRY